MLLEAHILVTDDYQSNIMNKPISKNVEFIFELEDVSGILPGDEKKQSSIIFLQGRDVLINLPFKPLMKKYKQLKNCTEAFSHEG